MSAASGRSGSKWLVVGLLAAGCIVVAIVARPSAGRPFDVDSTEAQGMKGLRLVLEADGSTVSNVSADDVNAGSGYDSVFVPVADGASPSQISRWENFVAGGGRLVLGTPVEGLGAGPADEFDDTDPDGFGFDLGLAGREPGECTIEGFGDVRDVRITGVADYLRVGAAQSCYGDGSQALVVESADGVANVGVPSLFDNASMGQPERGTDEVDVRDNVVVASRLLAPKGGERVAVVNRGLSLVATGSGQSVTDFIRPGIKAALWELAAAVAIFAWWRGRRHGRVVREPAVTPIAASELVDAVGNLLERQGDAANAAHLCRTAVGRDLSILLGLGPSPDPAVLAERVAHRCNRDANQVLATFVGPVRNDQEFLVVSNQLESLRQEVQSVRSDRSPTV